MAWAPGFSGLSLAASRRICGQPVIGGDAPRAGKPA